MAHPTSKQLTRARDGSPVLEIHDPTLKQLVRTRNGASQPACAFSAAPVHFQMSTLAISASPTRFQRSRFQRTCTFSTQAHVFILTRGFLASPVRF
ncbi:hypothetical protein PAXRUDRAFT_834209 [Paxillus rubicundulus Ve08.2h10]|uniref:Uncharacterized protein n=1 Tax=Paxillus rubicundulus Ve08.2h10 TaxID=930991 RepID=A0A0D0DEC0_9AGAM|nr:hypothetical protein PAXRUDRAFT_834209 [Paxillus rubicundulus Ve08.2h10]